MSKQVSEKRKTAIRFISWEAVQAWGLPSLSVPATIVLGYFQNIPWFYIYLSAGFVFAVIATGLLRFDEWRFRVTAKDKLAFHDLRVFRTLANDGSVFAIRLGFRLRNIATFPIQFEVQEMNTEFMNSLYPPKKTYEKKKIFIPVNGLGWFDDYDIGLANIEKKNKTIGGYIHARLKYGRPENLNQELEFKKKVFVKFDDKGNMQVAEWSDV